MYPGFFPFACLLLTIYLVMRGSKHFYAALWVTILLTAFSAAYYSSFDLPLLKTYHW